MIRIALLLMMVAFTCNAQVIPHSRTIKWDPGVRGGIPAVTNIYVSISASTSTAAIVQAHLDNAPSNSAVVLLNGLHGPWDNDILMRRDGVVLRGENQTNTVVHWQNVNGDSGLGLRLIMFDKTFDFDWNNHSPFDLVSPQKYDRVITTSVPHNIPAGTYVFIDQTTNWPNFFYLTNVVETPPMSGTLVTNIYSDTNRVWVYGTSGTDLFPISQEGKNGKAFWLGRDGGARPMGQVAKVISVTSDTLTIDPPLYYSYNNSPQVIEIDNWLQMSGLESMTLSNAVDVTYGNPRDNIMLQGVVNCWMKDVTILGCKRRDIWTYAALWYEMRGSTLDGGIPIGSDGDAQYQSDRAYPVFLGPHATAGLYTDNVWRRKTLGFAFEGCASGNVVSYNFITNSYWVIFPSDSDDKSNIGPLMHGAHPCFNLIEGNWSSDRVRADESWGTSSHFTVFRNRLLQYDRTVTHPGSQKWTVDIERNNDFWSFVGNIIGGGGGGSQAGRDEEAYERINGQLVKYDQGPSILWKIGYRSLAGDQLLVFNGTNLTTIEDTSETLYSYNTLNTFLRFYNWTYRTNNDVAGSGIRMHLENVVDPRYGYVPFSMYLDEKPTNFGTVLKWPPYSPDRPEYNAATNIPAGYRFYFGTNPPGYTRQSPVVFNGNVIFDGNIIAK